MKLTTLKSVMAVLMALFSLSAYAYDVEVDGIYYDLDRSNMTASVTYRDQDSYDNPSYSGSINIPETCTYKQKTYRVTSIGENAFRYCRGLTSVSIPNSVTSIGDDAFEYCSSLTTVSIPNSVTSIGDDAFEYCSSLTTVSIPNSVTSIGEYAFSNCSGLTSVSIPSSVTSIGDRAFSVCSGLKSVSIPNSVTSIGEYTFYDCSSLKSVSIPNSVTSIGGGAFSRCCGLTAVDIPNSITSIGDRAFHKCSGLTAVTIPNSISSVGDSPFGSCDNIKDIYCLLQDVNTLNRVFKDVSVGNTTLHVQRALIDNFYEYSYFDNVVALDVNIDGIYYYLNPENRSAEVLHGNYTGDIAIPTSVEYKGNTYAVTSISYGVFRNNGSLTSVSIGNSITSIGDNAFYGCRSLTSVSIGNSITSIGSLAFYGCSSLTAVNIPNSVTSIGNSTFCDCTGLTSVSIPNSVTSIGNGTFYNCSGLTVVSIPSSVTSIGDEAFYGCSGLTSVNIPNSVTSIGYWAFYGCSSLTTVDIPNSVTSIGEYAFSNCSGLTSVSIPNSVTSIGSGAFQDCSGLTSVSIPNSVTSIEWYAFSGCSNLIDVYCYAKNSPSTNSTAFYSVNTERATLHVPEESLETYKNTLPWSGFGSFVSLEDNKVIYLMTINVSDLRGTVTYGETSITNREETFDVKEGSDVVLMLTPRDGCKVKSVKVNGIEKVAEVNGGGELTIANVEGNLSVEVEFECAGDYMTATIGSNGFATFCSMEALDFSEVEDVKAYLVSTYQPKKGEVTLTRVYEVPAGMGLVLIGKEGEYEIPLGTGEAMVSNLLVGINENTTLKATEEGRTNFILPEDQEEAAFCAVTDEVELPFGKAYLPLPTESVAHLKDGKLTIHLADPSLGDVDGDGYVNISDVTTLVNIILGK